MYLSIWRCVAARQSSTRRFDVSPLMVQGTLGRGGPSAMTTNSRVDSVRRFATELAIGDLLLLRTGVAEVCALGVVAGEYL